MGTLSHAGMLAGALGATAVVVLAPPFVSFGVVVAVALSWCAWLESHPDA